MNGGLELLSVGFQEPGHLLFTNGCAGQFRGLFFLASVIAQRLGVGQQPRRLAEQLVDQGGRGLGSRTTHLLGPSGCDKTSEWPFAPG